MGLIAFQPINKSVKKCVVSSPLSYFIVIVKLHHLSLMTNCFGLGIVACLCFSTLIFLLFFA